MIIKKEYVPSSNSVLIHDKNDVTGKISIYEIDIHLDGIDHIVKNINKDDLFKIINIIKKLKKASFVKNYTYTSYILRKYKFSIDKNEILNYINEIINFYYDNPPTGFKIVPNSLDMASKDGTLIRALRNKIKITYDKIGYCTYRIARIDGKNPMFKCHRAIALTYISNEFNKPFINHIDGNKINNNINNLEWCTNEENIRHAFKMGLHNTYKNKLTYEKRLSGDLITNNKLEKSDVIKIRKLHKNKHDDIINNISNLIKVDKLLIEKVINKEDGFHIPKFKIPNTNKTKQRRDGYVRNLYSKQMNIFINDIAKMYNVTYGCIYYVIKKMGWKYL